MTCVHCQNDDKRMIEVIVDLPHLRIYLCAVCGKSWQEKVVVKPNV